MERPFTRITREPHGRAICVRLKSTTLDEAGLEEFGAEMARLLDEQDCHRLILCLGPTDPDCLFSVFLAKLIHLKRRLENAGGTLVLAQASDNVRHIFAITGLEKYFTFHPDVATALKELGT
jgi:anti-anti-sigma factor